MNNLEHIKECLYNDNFLKDYLKIKEDEINNITPEKIANAINGDCDTCLCYGCRLFTMNYVGSKYKFDKKQCRDFIINYFSRDFNLDTDLCQCPSCRTKRNEDCGKHWWKLSYNDITYYVYEDSLPEAKSYTVNNGIFKKEDYPYIKGAIVDGQNVNGIYLTTKEMVIGKTINPNKKLNHKEKWRK